DVLPAEVAPQFLLAEAGFDVLEGTREGPAVRRWRLRHRFPCEVGGLVDRAGGLHEPRVAAGRLLATRGLNGCPIRVLSGDAVALSVSPGSLLCSSTGRSLVLSLCCWKNKAGCWRAWPKNITSPCSRNGLFSPR